MQKIICIFTDDTKKLSSPHIFTADHQLDAFAILVDILENEVDSGRKFSNQEIQEIFSTNKAEFGKEKLAIIDWNGKSCPVETATKHLSSFHSNFKEKEKKRKKVAK